MAVAQAMMQKTRYILVILFILATVFLFLRLINIDRTLAQDEILQKSTFLLLEYPGSFLGDYGQPPLWQLPNSILASMLGTSNWVFRVIPLASSIATTILLLFYLRKKLGAEYAILGLLLLAFFPWQINTSNQVLQTSLLTLLMISSVFSAEWFINRKELSYLMIAAALSATAMLTMFIAVIAPIAICTRILFEKSIAIKDRLKYAFVYGGTLTVLFGAAIALVYLIYPPTIINTIAHTQDLGGFFRLPVLGMPSVFILSLWAGPMALLFLLVLLTRTKTSDYTADIHLLYLLASLFIFLVFNSDLNRPFDRYFMVIIPSMIILIISYGKDLFDHLIQKKGLFLQAFILLLAFFLLLGATYHHMIPLEPKMEFIKTFMTSLGRVMVPYSSNGGPVGFYVPGLILYSGWAVCAALSVLFILSRNRTFPVLLISAVLALNLCVSLYQAGLMDTPNPNKATSDLVDNLDEIPLEKEVFVYRDQGIIGYLPKGIAAERFELATFDNVTEGARDYSVIIVDFPLISKENKIWDKLNGCKRAYYSDRYGVEESIYTCRPTL